MLKPNELILLMKSLARKYDSQRTRGLFIEVRENIFSYFWRILWLFLNSSDDIEVKRGTFARDVFHL